MKGNPRFGYSQKSAVTNLREQYDIGKALKEIEKDNTCAICDKVAGFQNLVKVRDADGLEFYMCMKCFEDVDEK